MLLGRLTGRPLPPLLALALTAAGEAGPGQGDGGAEVRDCDGVREPGRGLGVFKLFLDLPRPIDIRAESDLWKPSLGVGGPLRRGEGVLDMVSPLP